MAVKATEAVGRRRCRSAFRGLGRKHKAYLKLEDILHGIEFVFISAQQDPLVAILNAGTLNGTPVEFFRSTQPKKLRTRASIDSIGSDAAACGEPYRAVNSSKVSSSCPLAFLALVLKK